MVSISLFRRKIELITAYGPSSDDSDSEKKNVRKINSKSNEIPSTKSNFIYNGKFAQPPNPSSPKPALVTKSVFSNENTVDGNLSDSRLNHKSDQESLSQNSNELLKTMTETKDSTRSSSNSASPLRATKEVNKSVRIFFNVMKKDFDLIFSTVFLSESSQQF